MSILFSYGLTLMASSNISSSCFLVNANLVLFVRSLDAIWKKRNIIVSSVYEPVWVYSRFLVSQLQKVHDHHYLYVPKNKEPMPSSSAMTYRNSSWTTSSLYGLNNSVGRRFLISCGATSFSERAFLICIIYNFFWKNIIRHITCLRMSLGVSLLMYL